MAEKVCPDTRARHLGAKELHQVFESTLAYRALWLRKHPLWASQVLPEQESYKGGRHCRELES